MKAIIIISLVLVLSPLLGLVIYLYRMLSTKEWFKWIEGSIMYPFNKRSANKLFKNLTPKYRRDLWLKSIEIEDRSKWYYRRLEKFIRNKYIVPIVTEYGKI